MHLLDKQKYKWHDKTTYLDLFKNKSAFCLKQVTFSASR